MRLLPSTLVGTLPYGRGLVKRLKGDLRGANDDIAAAVAVTPDIATRFANLMFVAPSGN